jgi:hypothetical protein
MIGQAKTMGNGMLHVSSRSWEGTTQRAAAWETNKPLVIVRSLAPNIYKF